MRTIDPRSIEKLMSLLKTASKDEPLSLRDLGKKLRCSRDAVIRKLTALKRQNGLIKVKATLVREGKRGPMSEAYYVGGGV